MKHNASTGRVFYIHPPGSQSRGGKRSPQAHAPGQQGYYSFCNTHSLQSDRGMPTNRATVNISSWKVCIVNINHTLSMDVDNTLPPKYFTFVKMLWYVFSCLSLVAVLWCDNRQNWWDFSNSLADAVVTAEPLVSFCSPCSQHLPHSLVLIIHQHSCVPGTVLRIGWYQELFHSFLL